MEKMTNKYLVSAYGNIKFEFTKEQYAKNFAASFGIEHGKPVATLEEIQKSFQKEQATEKNYENSKIFSNGR